MSKLRFPQNGMGDFLWAYSDRFFGRTDGQTDGRKKQSLYAHKKLFFSNKPYSIFEKYSPETFVLVFIQQVFWLYSCCFFDEPHPILPHINGVWCCIRCISYVTI